MKKIEERKKAKRQLSKVLQQGTAFQPSENQEV
jgi:hypothetical protein